MIEMKQGVAGRRGPNVEARCSRVDGAEDWKQSDRDPIVGFYLVRSAGVIFGALGAEPTEIDRPTCPACVICCRYTPLRFFKEIY